MTQTVYDYIATDLEICKKESLAFPFLDYGYLYGYGLFESIPIDQGKALLLDSHIDRMKRGAIILDIPFKYTHQELKDTVEKLIKKNNINKAILNFDLSSFFTNSSISIFFSFFSILCIYDLAKVSDSLLFDLFSSCIAFIMVSFLFGNNFFPK